MKIATISIVDIAQRNSACTYPGRKGQYIFHHKSTYRTALVVQLRTHLSDFWNVQKNRVVDIALQIRPVPIMAV